MAEQEEQQDTKQYYVLGVIVLIAIVVAGYFLRPKTATNEMAPTTSEQTAAPTPTPGQINGLACDYQYYNPRIGFAEYYLSVEGGDVSDAKTVDCTFEASQSGEIVATAEASSPLTEAPQRSGSTFRCTTKATAIPPRVVTSINVTLTDDKGESATCSAPFVFPAP